MLAHILHAGVRALAASVVLGTILIYAVGGIDSPHARPLTGVIAVGFFIFWIVFAFLFGRRVPRAAKRDGQTEVEGGSMSWARGSRREHGEHGEGDDDAGSGDAGSGDGGD